MPALLKAGIAWNALRAAAPLTLASLNRLAHAGEPRRARGPRSRAGRFSSRAALKAFLSRAQDTGLAGFRESNTLRYTASR
jgi:hypothetical protein